MTVPTRPADLIRQALSDAVIMRRNHPDAGDLALIARYEAARLALDQGRLTALESAAASHVNPDGTLTLSLADLLILRGSLRDSAAYRRGELCPSDPRSRMLAEAYAGLAHALGGDR